jgi:hypothetical protein
MRNGERRTCASYGANYVSSYRLPGQDVGDTGLAFGSYLEPMVVLCSSICFTLSDLCPSVVLDERPSVQNRFHLQGHLLDHSLVIEG